MTSRNPGNDLNFADDPLEKTKRPAVDPDSTSPKPIRHSSLKNEARPPNGKARQIGPGPEERYRDQPAQRDFSPPSADYRDYRGFDYRGSDYRANDPVADGFEGQINWAAALWRYRFALILPALLGLALGGAYFTTRPNLYRSTARIVVESDKPWLPDSDKEGVASLVPPSELLLMQLRSEQVLDHASRHPLLADVAANADLNGLRFLLSDGVQFEDAMQKSRSDRALAFFLHFDHEDPQFAVNAVIAMSDGLQNFFAKKSETSIAELKKLITTAKDKLLPELNTLESEYRVFREKSELAWDQNGVMINPYREKQLALQSRRLSLEDDHRDLSTKLTAINRTIQATRDPLLAMEVIQQLLGEELFAARKLLEAEDRLPGNQNATRDEDLSLAGLTIERTLMPLEVERQQFASQFGNGHPSVVEYDQRINSMREKLLEVTALETQRFTQLRLESESPSGEIMKLKRERAELSVSGFVRALETRQSVQDAQMQVLDKQIGDLAEQASRLARAESENAMYLRRIDRSQKLFDSVEEQMTRISLSDQGSAIHVSELNPASAPSLVSPILTKFLALGTMLGGMAGLALVYLLESHSQTYRSSEEIASTLGLRVLSHVPTDNHKLPKPAKGETYCYEGIDPGLSSVHRPRSATSEAIRRLRTSLFFDATAIDAKVIQVTSPLPEDGKSTLAANLAISIARSGKSVVIVDADMRRPQMTASFAVGQHRGLSDLINGDCDPTQVVHATLIENLSIVPCGPIPANPAEALSMGQFTDFLAWLRDRYDYVIVDTPPLLIVTDPAIVSSVVDGVVFTFRERRGCRPQTKEAVAMLRATGTPIFGCVVNRVDQNSAATGYQSYQVSDDYKRRYANVPQGLKTSGDAGGIAGEFVISPTRNTVGNREVSQTKRSQ